MSAIVPAGRRWEGDREHEKSAIVPAGRSGEGEAEHRSERTRGCVSEERRLQRTPGRPGGTVPGAGKPAHRAGFPSVPTCRGVRLDGHLLRGGAATRTVDHCTSPPFVPNHRTGCPFGVQERLTTIRPPVGS